MRFTYKSIGPIGKADVQLGRLTVISGNNNAGKTYLVYSLYGLLQHLNDADAHNANARKLKFKGINQHSINKLNKVGEITIDLASNEIVQKCLDSIRRLSEQYSDNMHATFNGDVDYFNESRVVAKVENKVIEKHIQGKLQNSFQFSHRNRVRLSYDNIKQRLTISTEIFEDMAKRTTRIEDVCEAIYECLIRYSFPSPFITTSQRNGVSMFYKDLDYRRYIQLEPMVNPKRPNVNKNDFEFLDKDSSKYSSPISDEIDFVRKLDVATKPNDSLGEDAVKKMINELLKITGARYTVSDTGIRHVADRKNKDKFNVPLHMASASSIELTELYFYLSFQARKGDLLIIDEPESHLSHINQIYLTRLLSLCVKYEISVLLTTHSDIILKEINNMYMYEKLPEKYRTEFSDQYDPDMGIDSEVLKCYSCIDGEVRACTVNNWGMEIPNFDDAHFSLHNRAVNLYSLLVKLGYD